MIGLTISGIAATPKNLAAGPLTPPYSGYCSQDCRPCYYPGYGADPSAICPPDAVTGFNQVCARTRIC